GPRQGVLWGQWGLGVRWPGPPARVAGGTDLGVGATPGSGGPPNMLAAELGVMTVRLERAIRSLDGVARVHVNRWGDGAAHLHLWFLARPYGRLQLRGTF